mmetsp:Transcript_136241/g.423369  ORF Transcript_136241/g.423369 Transcript_136241/m.423369 type:complete len:259 (+) Transcript_136241:1642-2418(+)
MDAVPPGACWNRGAASGVSTGASRASRLSSNASLELSTPRMTLAAPPAGTRVDGSSLIGASTAPSPPRQIVVAPPTGPLTGTASVASSEGPRRTLEAPPGACEKRGTASGVSMPAARCAWYWLRMPSVSSLPSTTTALPPTGGRRAPLSAAGSAAGPAPPRLMEATPPGACWKRGAAAGVSTAAPRSSLRCANASERLSLPRVTLTAPPTGPLTSGGHGAPAAPSSPSEMLEVPPGACWNRGAAARGAPSPSRLCSSG